MPAYSPILCSEMEGTANENPSLEGFDCTVKLSCPWANRYALVSDLLLNSRQWPHVTGAGSPRAKTCSIKPFGFVESSNPKDGQCLVYQDAHVTVNYSQRHFSQGNGEKIFAEELEPTIEFQTLDHREFRWGHAGGDVVLEAEAPGKLTRGFNYVKTFFFVQNPPAALIALPGHVNQQPLASDLLPWTFPEETLLYTPPHMSRSVTTTAGDAWTVRLAFSYKVDGWNKYYRAKSQLYEKMVHYESNSIFNSYPLADFSIFVNLGI